MTYLVVNSHFLIFVLLYVELFFRCPVLEKRTTALPDKRTIHILKGYKETAKPGKLTNNYEPRTCCYCHRCH